jgi:hypothetical protein
LFSNSCSVFYPDGAFQHQEKIVPEEEIFTETKAPHRENEPEEQLRKMTNVTKDKRNKTEEKKKKKIPHNKYHGDIFSYWSTFITFPQFVPKPNWICFLYHLPRTA